MERCALGSGPRTGVGLSEPPCLPGKGALAGGPGARPPGAGCCSAGWGPGAVNPEPEKVFIPQRKVCQLVPSAGHGLFSLAQRGLQ